MAFFPAITGGTTAKKKPKTGNPGVWGTAGTPAPAPTPKPAPLVSTPIPQMPLPQVQYSNPYAGLIGGMPDLSALESVYKAQSADDAAARDAALRRLVISYGQMPDFNSLGISDKAKGFLSGALNDEVRQLAANAENEGVSVHARQAKANEVANRKIPALLAGRGLLRSGQTGYDLNEQAQNYKNQQYDTLNELLSNVEGTVGNFLAAERQRQLALAEARMQAAWNAFQNWGDYSIQQQPQYAPGPQLVSTQIPGGGVAIHRPITEAQANKQAKQVLLKLKNNKPGTVGFRPF